MSNSFIEELIRRIEEPVSVNGKEYRLEDCISTVLNHYEDKLSFTWFRKRSEVSLEVKELLLVKFFSILEECEISSKFFLFAIPNCMSVPKYFTMEVIFERTGIYPYCNEQYCCPLTLDEPGYEKYYQFMYRKSPILITDTKVRLKYRDWIYGDFFTA